MSLYPTSTSTAIYNLTCLQNATFDQTFTWSQQQLSTTSISLSGAILTPGSNIITGIDTTGLTVGSVIFGGIPISPGTYITSVDDPNQISLNQNVNLSTSSLSNTITTQNIFVYLSNPVPYDITLFNAKMQIRYGSNLPILWQGSDTDLYISHLYKTSSITLGGIAGTIRIQIPAIKTKIFPVGNTLYYDLVLTRMDGYSIRVIQGSFTVVPGITTPS